LNPLYWPPNYVIEFAKGVPDEKKLSQVRFASAGAEFSQPCGMAWGIHKAARDSRRKLGNFSQ
jgi:hypothetical protein